MSFFIYADNWSDELAWFEYNHSDVNEITALPESELNLNLKSVSYGSAGYLYKDAASLHMAGLAVEGAQLAFVDASSGSIQSIEGAVTNTSGNVTLTAPVESGVYYLTAYIPEGTIDKHLIMSLTKLIVDENAPHVDPCALKTLSVASMDSNPDALEMIPAFDKNVYEYSVSAINYHSEDNAVWKSLFVKAAAESETAVIFAECNGISKQITGALNWTGLMEFSTGVLQGGKNNILTITVAESDQENAKAKTYTVTIPMKPNVNTAPVSVKDSDETTVAVGNWICVDLPENFTDADEVDILTYKVSVNGGEYNSLEYAEYYFTPETVGTYTLCFVANDGSDDSEPYTLTVNAVAMDTPTCVVDYLCIGSQYTNAHYGTKPETTLTAGLKSLGNFGGYITYYYENPLTDNPRNKYGMDFYVIGNAYDESSSFAEPGQVYVSEDGEVWYALAGSEHYESETMWDYEIIYTKGDDGKAYWTDNRGNEISYDATQWPDADNYKTNNVAQSSNYKYKGIALGGSGESASHASDIKFGYTDKYISNISDATLLDINPYVEAPTMANGFDLAWAVDEKGTPVEVNDKEFHYVKIATASNIWAGSIGEKSTEVSYVIRTTPQAEEVDKTSAQTGVMVSDGTENKIVSFNDGQDVYTVNLNDMKYVSVAVNGTTADDNIYINNQRVVSGCAAGGFKVTKENGEAVADSYALNYGKNTFEISAENSDHKSENVTLEVTRERTRESSGKSITVYFTLYGDEEHGSGVVHTYKNDKRKLPVWISRKAYNVDTGSVVLDVVEKSLREAGCSWQNVGGNYISEIKGLSELANSSLSGWMYLVNGETSELGVAEKTLKNGDSIEFFYTDDYTQEHGSEEWQSGGLGAFGEKMPSEEKEPATQPLKTYFADVPDNAWYKSAVEFAVENNLFNGVSEKEFAPSASMTRAMLVTVLHRLEKAEGTGNAASFLDIAEGMWYSDAVSWAAESGIVTGVSENRFAPDSGITREQMATILYRYASIKGYIKSEQFALSEFTDSADISSWAYDALCWANAEKLINGRDNGSLAPQDGETRAEVAEILMRFCENYIK